VGRRAESPRLTAQLLQKAFPPLLGVIEEDYGRHVDRDEEEKQHFLHRALVYLNTRKFLYLWYFGGSGDGPVVDEVLEVLVGLAEEGPDDVIPEEHGRPLDIGPEEVYGSLRLEVEEVLEEDEGDDDQDDRRDEALLLSDRTHLSIVSKARQIRGWVEVVLGIGERDGNVLTVDARAVFGDTDAGCYEDAEVEMRTG
jgi:hypothetical protein